MTSRNRQNPNHNRLRPGNRPIGSIPLRPKAVQDRPHRSSFRIAQGGAESRPRCRRYPGDGEDLCHRYQRHSSPADTLNAIEADLGAPEVILFNAARVAYQQIFEHPVEEIDLDWKVCLPRPSGYRR